MVQIVTASGTNEPAYVLVYSMGKVGSTAVADAIAAAGLNVRHVHSLRLDKLIGELQKSIQTRKTIPLGTMRRLLTYQDLALGLPLPVVSLIRDPLTRNVSALFQNWHKFIPEAEARALSPGHILQLFKERYPHNLPDNWFDLEIKRHMEIDVFAESHSFEHGALTVGDRRFLLMESGLENEEKSRHLTEHLGREIIVGYSNETSTKPEVADRYPDVLRLARNDEPLLAQMQASRLYRRFYATSAQDLRLDAEPETGDPASRPAHNTGTTSGTVGPEGTFLD